MEPRRYRAGQQIEDLCRACKADRMHTVIVVDAAGAPLRVSCGFCGSEHNFRGGGRTPSSATTPHRPTVDSPSKNAPGGSMGRDVRAMRDARDSRDSRDVPSGAREMLGAPAAPTSRHTTVESLSKTAPGGDVPSPRDARAGSPPPSAAADSAPFPLISDRERMFPPMSVDSSTGSVDIELLLRRVIREESGLTTVTPSAKWRGGQLVLKPGNPELQEKSWPIETFFHKIVMLRNRLRTLEQQVNATDLPEDAKVRLQSYITGCYGSLTSFNVLFAEEDDRFTGSGGD